VLTGLRVLDCSDARGHLAGRILADLGAEVVKLEPPSGDPVRLRGPFAGPAADPERSIPWLALNAGKRSIRLDLSQSEGRERFRQLLAGVDVLLETFAPGTLEAWGLGWEAMQQGLPRLIRCAITPYGQKGPYADLSGGDLTVVAMGGNAIATGPPERPPVRCSMPTSHYHAAPEAVLGILMALHAREQTGRGQLVDVSMQECQLATLMAGPGQLRVDGRKVRRSGGHMGRTREIWPAKDGWISFGLRGGPSRVPNLVAMVALMDECGMAPDWLKSYDWSRYHVATVPDAEIARLEAAFAAFFRTRTMRELYDEALRRRILLAPCNDAAEVLAHPQLRSRELFACVEIPGGGSLELPAFFVRRSDGPPPPLRRAPRVGEHDREVLAEWTRLPAAEGPDAPSGGLGARGIFQGLHILEFGGGAAGPLCTKYFCEQGAQVVRVESRKRPDFLRLLRATAGDPEALEKAPMFVLLNPDKKSVALNLQTGEGRELARRLVAEWADVVTENFAPGVMERLGLDWEHLRAIKPDLVMLSSSLFGQTGPQRQYPGFGGQGSAIAGFNHLTGYPDAEAHGPFGTITDSLSPRFAAAALAAALLERRRSGRGRYLDVSQIECGVYSLSAWIAAQSAGAEAASRRGNRSPEAAPHGIFPVAGDDRWIALAVRRAAEWSRLCRCMGDPPWARDPRFHSAAGRLAHVEELEAGVAAFTADQRGPELMEQLRRAGLEVGLVQDCSDLLEDPQLRFRGHFQPLVHARLGELPFERCGFRLSGSPGGFRRAGPLLGEHSSEVLGGILGLSEPEIRRLEEQGVVV